MKLRHLRHLRLLVGCAIWLVGIGAGWWAPAAFAQTVTFDFDTATPALTTGQNLPFDQSSGGVTVHFRAASGGFSVQDYSSTGLTLSLFSGNYMYPNSTGGVMVVEFSQQITNVLVNFATAEETPNENPNPVRLTAYTNSTSLPPLGSTVLAGTYIGVNGQPMGTLTFNSATPFNLITLNLEPGLATGLMMDNLTVKISGGTNYSIVTSASPAAGGTTSGDGNYLSGAPVTLLATPNPDYIFVDWTEAGVEVSTSPDYVFAATADRTLVANFAPAYTLTTSASPLDGGSTTGDGTYPGGSVVSVSATTSLGYAFVNWTENGVPVSSWANYQFAVTTNRDLVANFAPACAITTSSSWTDAGFTCGDGQYAVGSSVTVMATPMSGYTFMDWTENDLPVSTSATYSFTASTNRTLVANFTTNVQTVTFDFDTATPFLSIGQTTAFDQTSGGLTASFSSTNDPAFLVQSDFITGWVLPQFSGNYLAPNVAATVLDIQFSQPVTNINLAFATLDFQDMVTPATIGLAAYESSTATLPLATTTAQGSFTPGNSMPMGGLALGSATPFQVVRILLPPTTQGATEFAVDNITVQLSQVLSYMITTGASPSGGGSTSGGGAYTSGASVTVTASANPGYAFVNWTEGGTEVSTLTSYDFTATADRTLVANFVPTWNIAATANPAAGGLITGAATYTNNASVTLAAAANPGYAFVNWTENGSPVGASLSLTFTATADRTLVANFVPTWNIAATANPAAGGLITGAATYTNNASVTLTATANPGYDFVNWTENGSPVGASLSLTFTATADRTLVANFNTTATVQISLTSTNTVLVSWPANLVGFLLQENSSFDSAGWADTTNTVNVVGEQNQVVQALWAGSRFFRLSHP